MKMSEKNINIDSDVLDLIQASVEAGVTRGVALASRNSAVEQSKRNKKIYDNRIRNTKLLLYNYRRFKKSIDNAVFSEKELDTLSVNDLLNKIEDIDYNSKKDEVIVESILKSKKRTEIIMSHINKILNLYFFEANNNNDDIQKERANIIYEYFVKNDKKPNYFEMSDLFNKSDRQIRRDIAKGIEEIAILMFGIDGIQKCF